jgi:hypothetical protein
MIIYYSTTIKGNENMRKLLIILLLALTALLQCREDTEVNALSALYFCTPEEAVEYFVKAVAENNLDKALQACAIDNYCEAYDFKEFAEYSGRILLFNINAPSEYELYLKINKYDRLANMSKDIMFFVMSFNSPIEFDGSAVYDGSEEDIIHFIEAVNPAKLKNLKIECMSFPLPELESSERHVKSAERAAKLRGALTSTERLLLFELDGRYFLGGIRLLKYSKGWQIENMVSVLGGTSPLGAVNEITESEAVLFKAGCQNKD